MRTLLLAAVAAVGLMIGAPSSARAQFVQYYYPNTSYSFGYANPGMTYSYTVPYTTAYTTPYWYSPYRSYYAPRTQYYTWDWYNPSVNQYRTWRYYQRY